MASTGNHRELMSDINVTPFVDVMLVLLIIFMVTAPMMIEGLNVDLPEATAKPLDSEKEHLVITIDKELLVFGKALQPLGTHHLEHPHRIVAGALPQWIADCLEKVSCGSMPTPPEIVGDIREPPDAIRNRNRAVHVKTPQQQYAVENRFPLDEMAY